MVITRFPPQIIVIHCYAVLRAEIVLEVFQGFLQEHHNNGLFGIHLRQDQFHVHNPCLAGGNIYDSVQSASLKGGLSRLSVDIGTDVNAFLFKKTQHRAAAFFDQSDPYTGFRVLSNGRRVIKGHNAHQENGR